MDLKNPVKQADISNMLVHNSGNGVAGAKHPSAVANETWPCQRHGHVCFWHRVHAVALCSSAEHVVHGNHIGWSCLFDRRIDKRFKDLQVQCRRCAALWMPLNTKAEPIVFD